MTATINEYGTLIVQADTSLEGYALKKWMEANFKNHNIDIAYANFNCAGEFIPTESEPFNITVNALFKNQII